MQYLAFVLLAPILVVQGLWVVLRASRLPEAKGPRTGSGGSGDPLRVLITGDSSAAGVGAETQDDALAGQVCRALGVEFSVTWTLVAKSGGTAASTDVMVQSLGESGFDIAVIALGVNDTKNGVSAKAWRQNYMRLIHHLHTQCGVGHVYVSGLPAVHHFPLLPSPLRQVLGKRAVYFDAILQDMATATIGVTYIPMDIPFDVAKMADDGFHPGPDAYAAWGERIATEIIKHRR